MKTERKKIVFVINYFYPDLASTGQLMTDLCRDLQNDFDITVVAAQPGYAGESTTSSKLIETDYLENIKVIRVKLPTVDKTSKASRLKYISSYFFLALFSLLKERNISVIYTISQPPILGGLIGTIGKLAKRTKHLYNIQDFNPEQAEAAKYSASPIIFKIARAIDLINCRYANEVVVVGKDMAETLKNRFKSKKTPKHSVINNWINEEDVVPLESNNAEIQKFKKKHNLDGKFIVMYSGNLGLYYDLENIVTIAEHFKDNDDISFVYIGEGAMKQTMVDYVKDKGLQNVTFLPYQPKSFIKYSLNSADVHLVVNQKGIKGVSVPSKIYGVMAAGKPILGVLEKHSEAERLISASESGVVVEPHDYLNIVSKINYFYNLDNVEMAEMGKNGRVFLEENLKKDASINKYKDILNNI
ncbi:glycosyltransferase family 4 protein [Halobacillus faecis]